jgi:hypothetical protein
MTSFLVTDKRRSNRPSETVVDLDAHHREARSRAAIELVDVINAARYDGHTQAEAEKTAIDHPAWTTLTADGADQALLTVLLLAAFLDATHPAPPAEPEPTPESETEKDQWIE